jgi:hypothetical protein
MTFDERIEALTARHEALTMNLELLSRDLEAMRLNSERDGENIRALARIAEIHERRGSAAREAAADRPTGLCF